MIVFATYQLHIAGVVGVQSNHTLSQTKWWTSPVDFSARLRMPVERILIVNQFFAGKTVGCRWCFRFMIMRHAIVGYCAALIHLQCCFATKRARLRASEVSHRTAWYSTFMIEMAVVKNLSELLVDALILNGILRVHRIRSCGIEQNRNSF